MNRALSVGGAIYRRVVNGDKAGIAGKLEVRVNEAGAYRHRFAKRRKSVLGSVTTGTAMSYG